jgi:glutamine synthetase
LGFPEKGGEPKREGAYYCAVGSENVSGRKIVEEYLDLCLDANLTVEGINGQAMKGQWEFQVFAKQGRLAGDQLWVARYLLQRTGEKYNTVINLNP